MMISSIHIDFLSADGTSGAEEGGYDKKVSPYFSIIQSENCQIICSVEHGDEFQLQPMECMLVPSKKMQAMRYSILPGQKCRTTQWIYMDIILNGRFKLDDLYDFPAKLPSPYTKAVYGIIRAIRSFPDQSVYLCDRLSHCYQLVKILLEVATPKRLIDQGVLNTIAYIKEHYNEKLTTQCLAEIANMSISHFHRCFKRQTGKSPIDYVNDYRLSLAAHYLEQNALTINEIAAMLGFAEPYYFSKLFKRKFGNAPLKYRKALSRMANPSRSEIAAFPG